MAITPCRPAWKGQMSARARFNNQMHYRRVDRCFNMEFGYWLENFTQWDIFVKNGVTNNAEAEVFFNFDRFVHLGGTYWMHPGFPQEVVGETATTKIIRNYEGLLA